MLSFPLSGHPLLARQEPRKTLGLPAPNWLLCTSCALSLLHEDKTVEAVASCVARASKTVGRGDALLEEQDGMNFPLRKFEWGVKQVMSYRCWGKRLKV